MRLVPNLARGRGRPLRRFLRALAPALAAILVLSSSVAFATPSAKDKAYARELYTLGQQMFRQEDFKGARRAFEDAYQAVPNPIVLLSVAECQVRTEDYAGALVTLNRYLAERPDAPDRAQVEEQVSSLKAKPGIVTVESTPSGATIWVNGENSGRLTPADLELPAGEHVIAVQPDGHSPAEQKVTVLIGSQQRVNLSPIPQAPPPEVAKTDMPKVDIQAHHTSRGMLPIWIATGVAGAGLVTGTILGGLALSEKGNFDARPTERSADKGERLALFADVGFGIAAAAGITAVVLYVTRDKDADKKEQAWSLKPNIAKNNLGFTGRLKF